MSVQVSAAGGGAGVLLVSGVCVCVCARVCVLACVCVCTPCMRACASVVVRPLFVFFCRVRRLRSDSFRKWSIMFSQDLFLNQVLSYFFYALVRSKHTFLLSHLCAASFNASMLVCSSNISAASLWSHDQSDGCGSKFLPRKQDQGTRSGLREAKSRLKWVQLMRTLSETFNPHLEIWINGRIRILFSALRGFFQFLFVLAETSSCSFVSGLIYVNLWRREIIVEVKIRNKCFRFYRSDFINEARMFSPAVTPCFVFLFFLGGGFMCHTVVFSDAHNNWDSQTNDGLQS